MSYEYEGVLKVISRSRATLIFSMGVPMVTKKPQAGPGEQVSFCYADHPWRRYRRHLLVCL